MSMPRSPSISLGGSTSFFIAIGSYFLLMYTDVAQTKTIITNPKLSKCHYQTPKLSTTHYQIPKLLTTYFQTPKLPNCHYQTPKLSTINPLSNSQTVNILLPNSQVVKHVSSCQTPKLVIALLINTNCSSTTENAIIILL